MSPQNFICAPQSTAYPPTHTSPFTGMWIHGCIDGYSRYIVYLKVATSKLSEVVRNIFLAGMRECGWSSRCRWDRGKENILAIVEQVNHWWDRSDDRTLHRGSAITVCLSYTQVTT